VTAVSALRRQGYWVCGVETAEGASPLWQTSFQFPAAFVLGNEALGVEPAALALCDAVVELPCRGRKNSINVANCGAVVLYEALRQWEAATAG
jgi:tRNA G18 (ribose-2'-O)-methylase SpoU